MRILHRLRSYGRVLPTARQHRNDLSRWLVRRPQLLAATAACEVAGLASNRLDPRYKRLAEMKVAAMVNCEFCIDIGTALARDEGLDERELAELHRFETSDAFSDLDRQVLRFAEASSRTPAAPVDPALRADLVERLGPAAVTELAFAIAWEHHRARLNHALGVRPAGFVEAGSCPVVAHT